MYNKKQLIEGRIKVPKNIQLFETTIATLWVDETGMLCVLFKPVLRTIENNKEYIEVLAGLVKDSNKVCLLVDVTDTMPMRTEMREYLATEYPKYVKAVSVISAKPLERTLATTFQTLSTAGFPMNQFTNEKEAKMWLKLYM